jgi:hypothetical protein
MVMAHARRVSLVLAVILGLVALGPTLASAAPTADLTMADLLQGATIQSGDKLFYNFHAYSPIATGGATPVDPATIIVKPIYSAERDELGLSFQSASFFVSSGQTMDITFVYSMMVTDPNFLISDNTLTMRGSARGTGSYVNISEDILAVTGDLLGHNLVFTIEGDPTSKILSHQFFKYPVTSITVEKDISLVGGPDGGAAMSYMEQTFSQTPEPATLCLLAIGAIGTIVARRRRA